MSTGSYKARIKELENILYGGGTIDLVKLQQICFGGIPDDSGYRPQCWKVLLNYLPLERCDWMKVLNEKRKAYETFIEEMVFAPAPNPCEGTRVDVTAGDHPLNLNPDSKWQTYFKDNEVLLQIDKDVRRLCPDISFFQQPTEFPCKSLVENPLAESLRKRILQTVLTSANVTRNRIGITNISLTRKRAVEEYQRLPHGQEAHWEVVERILFIYAKLNPGQSYVQGMNEIIGPIYYTFSSDPDIEWRRNAEADTFFCFTNLMAEIRDFFIKTLDDSACGIGSMMNQLMDMLKKHDIHLWHRLQEQEVKPQFYSFRWITLLLSQEFPLPDVIRIWDSLFADADRFSFLTHVCCAMIILLRDQLLHGDFPSNVKLLQNFPSSDIHHVLAKAVELLS